MKTIIVQKKALDFTIARIWRPNSTASADTIENRTSRAAKAIENSFRPGY